MPLYKYKHIQSNDESTSNETVVENTCPAVFEELQDLSEPALTVCPRCGMPVERVIGRFAPVKSTKDILSNKNLAEKGFTRYEKAGNGYYEKTAGEGPNVISGH